MNLALATGALASCAGTRAPPAPPAADPSTASFRADAGPMPVFRSRRFELSLPLPDGKTWRIDDHSQPELVATHAPTRSRVTVAVFRANELVGHARCEELARERRLVPEATDATNAATSARVVEDEVTITQDTFDTRIEVLVEPGAGPGGPLSGRVAAFGGFLRKCFVFVYTTSVDGSTDEPVLSDRLAFVRARVLGGLELEPFDAVARSRGPADAAPRIAPGP
ncbi:MAG TPA: hypothetical protein VHV30_13150 [Polyangiaceae bacterium]|jgi:hypothetical protein|nr:hypothetical protein [Polyangiaceae bacterium]